ncbi:hypothetical protein HMN09_01147200 [Mycena chlorophos]|uniref:F-box domain-containing protein n=1 Tax=Mycena chlorophos TaxID=658473 RepID=A0A8H6S8C6_MYCCL|nr:hypothetical protein HMN09_01147200 [Mycena chlorophos]
MGTSSTAQLRAHLDEVRSHIRKDVQNLAELEAYQAAVHDELIRVASFPILSLPAEITSAIFVHCLPNQDEPTDADSDVVQLVLLHVCKTWARIALDTPQLWSFLRINVDLIPPGWVMDLIVGAWFRRRLIELDLSGTLQKFMQPLVKNAPKVSALTLRSRAVDVQDLVAAQLDFQQLHELSISRQHFEDGATVDLNALIARAPKLGVLHIDGIPPSAFAAAQHQLTDLRCYCYTPLQVLEVVRQFPNLLRLDARVAIVDQSDDDDDADYEVVTHPNLTHLRLDDADTLCYLTLPCLQALETIELPAEALSALLERSESPPLRQLRMYPDPASEDFISVFLTLAHLASLDLRFPSTEFTRLFFKQLSVDTHFLRALRDLRLEWHESVPSQIGLVFAVDLIGPAVVKRNALQDVQPLESLKLVARVQSPWTSFRIHEEMLATYRELKREGVDVYLGTTSESYV